MSRSMAPGDSAVADAAAANLFVLRVVRAGEKAREWRVTAAHRGAAVAQASAAGWDVLSVQRGDSPLEGAKGAVARGRERFDLLQFSQELLALLRAGLNLQEAVSALVQKERDAGARRLLQALESGLRQGLTFSDVLTRFGARFPEVYVATVRAAERTGDLARALDRYVVYQTQFDALRKRLTGAAIYPLLLLAVGVVVTLFLLGYVVPRFSEVYASAGRNVPWASALLLEFGLALWRHTLAFAAVAAAAFLGVALVLRGPRGRAWLLERVLALPFLRRRADEFRLARFYRGLGLLVGSGVPLAQALGMVGGLLGERQRAQLGAARQRVSSGVSLSQALAATGLVTPVAESLIRVAERTGQMAEMLERAASFEDDAFSRWVDWSSRLVEPLLMVLIGLVIGTVVVLMYLPIFELAGSLQ